jgi:lipoprotein-releasing system permease protein
VNAEPRARDEFRGLGGSRVGFVVTVARRLMLREHRSTRARTLAWASAAVLLLSGCLLAAGTRGPLVVASFWLASLVALVAVLVMRLRAMLVVSVLGLALGVASLFVVLGVASGIEQLLVDSLARLNGHAMVSKYGLDFYEYDDVVTKLEADPRVHAASPFVFGVAAIVLVEQEPESDAEGSELEPVVVTIKGVDPEQLDDFSTTAELFAAGDFTALRPAGPRTRPGVVLGTRLARRIGAQPAEPDRARPGDVVRIVVPDVIRQDGDATQGAPHHGEFEVLGLLDTGFAEFDATFVLVHLSAAQALVFGQRRASGIELELEHARLGQSMDIALELAEALNRPLTEQQLLPLYRAASWADRSATLISIRQTKALIVVVLSLIILVASGSLLGALLLLVRRERRHIGVFAALGARPAQLFWVFECVGVAIGGVGSLLGLAWGAVSLFALSLLRLDLDAEVYMIDHLPVAFVFADLLVPTVIAVMVCAVVTGPVALRVSRTRPLALLG